MAHALLAQAGERIPGPRIGRLASSRPSRPGRRARRPTRSPARAHAWRAPRAAAPGSVNAAVPRITRAAPAASAACDRLAPSAARRRTAPARPARRRSDAGARGSPARPRGAVEVDHVQAARARLDPAARGRQRVLVIDLLGVEVALERGARRCRRGCRSPGRGSPGAPAPGAAAQMRAKLASRRRPAAEDFSGWNCTPKKEPAFDRAHERRAVLGDAEHVRSSVGHGAKRVHVVEGAAAAADPRSAASAACSKRTSFQPMCGSFSARPRARAPRPG